MDKNDFLWGKRITFRLGRPVSRFGFEMLIHTVDQAEIVRPIALEKLNKGEFVEPTLCFETEGAQILMDELWRLGVRPSQEGSTSQLAAIKYHLEDMRAILKKKGVLE